MNIGTHSDYSNRIAFYKYPYKHKHSTKKVPTPHKRKWICWLSFLNVAANFCQCQSPIISKLSTWDKNQNLGKAFSTSGLSHAECVMEGGEGLVNLTTWFVAQTSLIITLFMPFFTWLLCVALVNCSVLCQKYLVARLLSTHLPVSTPDQKQEYCLEGPYTWQMCPFCISSIATV